jgi:hypothetical protein
LWVHDIFGNISVAEEHVVNINSDCAAINNVFAPEAPTVATNVDAIEFRWNITGDANQNAAVTVQYKKETAGSYSDAQDLFRWRFPEADGSSWNEMNGNIMFLDAGTVYDLILTLTDADGGSDSYTGQATTRAWPTIPTGGDTWYAASDGSGTTCSSGSPCALSYIISNKAGAGDVVKLKAGTYTGTTSVTVSGSSGNYIVWQEYGDGPPIIEEIIVTGNYNWFKDLTFDADNGCLPFYANGGDFGVVDGCTFTGGKICGTCASTECSGQSNIVGVLLDVSSTDWMIYDNTITGDRTINTLTTTSAGSTTSVIVGSVLSDYPDDFFDYDDPRLTQIKIIESGHASEGEARQVSAFENSTGVFTTAAFSNPIGSGVDVAVIWREHYSSEAIDMNKGSGHTIAYNRISGVGDGISYPGSNVSIFGNDIGPTHDDGIEGDFAYPNVRIWGNRITNSTNNLMSVQDMDNGAPWWIVKNQWEITVQGMLKMRDSKPIFLYHNTFIVWDDLVKYVSHEHRARFLMAKNNIFISYNGGFVWAFDGYDNETWTDIDYNFYDHQSAEVNPWDYDGSNYSTMTLWNGASGHDGNSIDGNYEDILTNVPTLGYAPPYSGNQIERVNLILKSGANAAVDAGVVLNNINDGYLGSAPDMGALERGDSLPTYGPRSVGTITGITIN